MARKVEQFKITKPGRDLGKTFVLKEMPATQGEKWAIRLFLAMSRNGIKIPAEVASAGLAGVAFLGIEALAGMRYEEIQPLLDEMMDCVTLAFDPAHPEATRGLVGDDIEEIPTIFELRKELLRLHSGFSSLADALTSASGLASTNT